MIPESFFADLDKLNLKFKWKDTGPRLTKATLKKKNKVGGITLPNIKVYHIAVVIKTVSCWKKDRHID